jgi:hypothetical protein
MVVTEAEYWARLEFRVCHELAGLPDNQSRGLWCDGFSPKRWFFDNPTPRITGRAWICSGSRQAQWEFTLFLPHPVGSVEEIDWASILPPENVTLWLALDPQTKRIQIEPSAAVPDPS